MKRFLVVFFGLFLVSCGDAETNNYVGEGFEIEVSENFSLTEDFEGNSKIESIGNLEGEVLLVLNHKGRHPEVIPSLILMKLDVDEDLSLRDFSEEKYDEIVGNLSNSGNFDFEEIQELDKNSGMYWADFRIENRHYKQIFALENEVGFILAAIYLENEEESIVNEIEEMLESFSLE